MGQLNATQAARSGDRTLDLLLYGDSLTYALQRPPQAAWRRQFGKDGRTPDTLALGALRVAVVGARWRGAAVAGADAWRARGGGSCARLLASHRHAAAPGCGARSSALPHLIGRPRLCLCFLQACRGQRSQRWPGAS